MPPGVTDEPTTIVSHVHFYLPSGTPIISYSLIHLHTNETHHIR